MKNHFILAYQKWDINYSVDESKKIVTITDIKYQKGNYNEIYFLMLLHYLFLLTHSSFTQTDTQTKTSVNSL